MADSKSDSKSGGRSGAKSGTDPGTTSDTTGGQKKATGGEPVASGASELGQDAQPHYTPQLHKVDSATLPANSILPANNKGPANSIGPALDALIAQATVTPLTPDPVPRDPVTRAPAPVFRSQSFAELVALPPKSWLIETVLGPGDLGMIYGPPGSGKSFLVIDAIFAACRGAQWALRFAIPRPLRVAYCAGEGLGGLPQRFVAAAHQHGVDDLPNFTFFACAPQLFTPAREPQHAPAETMRQFVHEWQQRTTPDTGPDAGTAPALDILIIDTLHSATAGADENSAQDMGRVLAAGKAAARTLGCAVILVHHSNKAGTGERGSSALRGAMDFMLEVKPAAGRFVMSCEKLKDAPAWPPQTFSLVALGDSARVWWDEPGAPASAAGKQQQDIDAILALLQAQPGLRYTATALAEAIGLGGSKQIFRLLPKAMQHGAALSTGQLRAGLKDAARDGGPHNPRMYWWEPAADPSGANTTWLAGGHRHHPAGGGGD